jgi:hypothetical protein
MIAASVNVVLALLFIIAGATLLMGRETARHLATKRGETPPPPAVEIISIKDRVKNAG